MVHTDEGQYLLERINRLEDIGKTLERSIKALEEVNIDQEARLAILETHLSLLHDINRQIAEIKTVISQSQIDVVEIKTKLNVYIGIVCVAGSAIGSLLPVIFTKILPLLAIL